MPCKDRNVICRTRKHSVTLPGRKVFCIPLCISWWTRTRRCKGVGLHVCQRGAEPLMIYRSLPRDSVSGLRAFSLPRYKSTRPLFTLGSPFRVYLKKWWWCCTNRGTFLVCVRVRACVCACVETLVCACAGLGLSLSLFPPTLSVSISLSVSLSCVHTHTLSLSVRACVRVCVCARVLITKYWTLSVTANHRTASFRPGGGGRGFPNWPSQNDFRAQFATLAKSNKITLLSAPHSNHFLSFLFYFFPRWLCMRVYGHTLLWFLLQSVRDRRKRWFHHTPHGPSAFILALCYIYIYT